MSTRAATNQGLTDKSQFALANEVSPTIIHDNHFTVSQIMWAFDGFHLIGSFNATAAHWVELNISSTTADPNYPNYIVELTFESANHGKTFVSGTSFSQAIKLNYTDAYNITICKHAFYNSVKVTGAIDVYHKEEANSNPTPSPTSTPSIALSPSPTTSHSPAPSQMPTNPQEPQPAQLPPDIIYATLGPAAILMVIFAIVISRKQKR